MNLLSEQEDAVQKYNIPNACAYSLTVVIKIFLCVAYSCPNGHILFCVTQIMPE